MGPPRVLTCLKRYVFETVDHDDQKRFNSEMQLFEFLTSDYDVLVSIGLSAALLLISATEEVIVGTL